MDKKTFMKELERSLSVLQENELSDIVSEYEQHIDMKVQSGLSEEEAIADFGSVAELTAEILEAYHVRADYASGPDVKRGRERIFVQAKEDGAEKGRKFFQQTGEACAKTGRKTVSGICKAGGFLSGILNWLMRQVHRPFLWAERKWRGRKNQCRENGSIKSAFCFCVKAAFWGIRICWNAGWVVFSLFCGGMGLCCLFGLGALVVLWMQGYPLAGVTIGCLGLNLCMFAAAGMGMTLLWRKRGQDCDDRNKAGVRHKHEEHDGQKEVQHA